MSTEIILPEMGEGIIEATLTRWLKAEGESVTQHEPIFELETDKVTTEILAEAEGVLLKILVGEGTVAPVGTVLGVIGQAGEDVTTPSADVVAEAQIEQLVGGVSTPAASLHQDRPYPPYSRKTTAGRVTPLVARMSAELNLDLTQIKGTGLHGRITKQDVLAYLETGKTVLPSHPATPPLVRAIPTPTTYAAPVSTPLAGDEIMPLTTMRRAIADHMVLSKRASPHVTSIFEADFSAIMAHRRTRKAEFAHKGVRLTFTPYLILAVAQALQDHPLVNSSWGEEGIILRREINIGMATALEQGLIVPVIKGADELNLLGMARTVNDLAERGRANKLKPDEVQGGTFTLTNHGVSGSLLATPIINQPQCGILGVGAIQERVVVVNGMIAIRPMTYLSFTFDHRILDGATADYFVAQVKRILESY